jgi:hypothetical protein
MSEEITLEEDGVEKVVDLAALAELDMTNVEEFEGGFEPTPKGVFGFECVDGELGTITSKGVQRAAIWFVFKIFDVKAITDPDINPDDWMGKEHREMIFVKDLKKSVGYAKHIMAKAGFAGNGKLGDLLDAFCGTRFYAPIKQTKDKNDSDRVYANIVAKQIVPMEAPATATAGGTALNVGG